MSISLNGDGIISGVSTLTNPSQITVGTGASIFSPASNTLALGTNGSERVRIDSSGNFGLGTNNPGDRFHVVGPTAGISARFSDSVNATVAISHPSNGTSKISDYGGNYGFEFASTSVNFLTAGSERGRIDSSGRLLIGTSTARSNFFALPGTLSGLLQIEGLSNASRVCSFVLNANDISGPLLVLGKSRGTTSGSYTVVSSGDQIGGLSFQGSDGSNLVAGASISAEVDGTPGSNDMPGRLVFSTTADGASSPTERMRITSGGTVYIGANPANGAFSNTGFLVGANGIVNNTTSGSRVAFFNRLTDDGTIIEIAQDTAVEGTISVSGTTVSYNGAHLSRWSQLPGGAERTEILRGTVLSNIEEMCEWGEEDNEQLNRMQVSDVEGDPNVAGVFQAPTPTTSTAQ
jgi:hypothetical protein